MASRGNHQQVTRRTTSGWIASTVWHSFLVVRTICLIAIGFPFAASRGVAVSNHYPQHSIVLQDASSLAEDGDQCIASDELTAGGIKSIRFDTRTYTQLMRARCNTGRFCADQ